MTEQTIGGVVKQPYFGVAPTTVTKLLNLFESFPGIDRVWIFGSRATGRQRNASDIDLAVDAATMDDQQFRVLSRKIEELELIYRTDVVWLQAI